MIIDFTTRRPHTPGLLAPLDFYRFRHRDELVPADSRGRRIAIARPLWVVGVSPFDPVTSEDEGHVVHLGAPRFTARWSLRDETIAALQAPDHLDDDLNLAIYETLLLEPYEGRMQEWLVEAACAVAYTKGLIAAVDPVERH